MATQDTQLLDELLPDLVTHSRHPMDSSRVLLGLMRLALRAESDEAKSDARNPLEGVISKGVLRALLSALQFRDPSTLHHCRRVARLSVGIARHLGWEGRDLVTLEVAGLLHDLGKLGVPDNILYKPGKLSPEEAELIRLHRHIGVDVLQACHVSHQVLELLSNSHADFVDVSQQHKLTGSDVPQGSRILAIADAYDSIGRDQAYRTARPHDEIMQELWNSAGTQFDGNVVHALARWCESEGLPFDGQQDWDGSTQQMAQPTPVDHADSNLLCHVFSYLYVLESLYDGFYLVDSDLRCTVWSRGAEHLLGRPATSILGNAWTSRLLGYADEYDNALEDNECPLKQVVETGHPVTRNVRLNDTAGDWIEVEVQSLPLTDEQGRLQGVAEIFRDLTRTGQKPREYRELKLAASRDALTSVANRGELETQLALLVSEYSNSRNPEPLSVVFLDVDFFKSINDTYGHTVGDKVLVDVARLLQQETHSGEVVGRYGGEEFVLICPATKLDQATTRAERIRVTLAQRKIGGLQDYQVTASFGAAEMEPGDSVESVLRRADKALYKAKETGRNRTCSLTSAQLLADDTGANADDQQQDFVRTVQFEACLASDIVIYKLGAFVNETGAKLVEVDSQKAVVQLRSSGLFPSWGRTDSRRPVEVVVEFGDRTRRGRRGASQAIPITVTVRPLGWVRDREAFNSRANRVIKSLRGYFVAND